MNPAVDVKSASNRKVEEFSRILGLLGKDSTSKVILKSPYISDEKTLSSPEAEPGRPLKQSRGDFEKNAYGDAILTKFIIYVIIAVILVLFLVLFLKKARERFRNYGRQSPRLNPSHVSYRKVGTIDKFSDDEDQERLRQENEAKSFRIRNFMVRVITLVWNWLESHYRRLLRRCLGSSSEVNDLPLGFLNIGNTCYFNSIIQVLKNTRVLQQETRHTDEWGELLIRFKKACQEDPEGLDSGSLDLSRLHDLFCSKVKRFSGYGEHDSHEFLRHFLDELRKEEERRFDGKRVERLTMIDRVFGGHSMTLYECKNCGATFHICEPFLDISLPVVAPTITPGFTNKDDDDFRPRTPDSRMNAAKEIMTRLGPHSFQILRYLPGDKRSLEDCMSVFTRVEHIQDEYLCQGCYKEETWELLSSATKQTLIFNPPAILTLHLKRFELKPGGSVKRNDFVSFPEFLDIAPYCSAHCLRNDPRSPNIWYSLYGVVVHSGTLTSGHYYAYVKVTENDPDIRNYLQMNLVEREVTLDALERIVEHMNYKERKPEWTPEEEQGTWYRMNDSWVSPVAVGEVLRQNAYLLFYRRVVLHT